MKTLLSLWVWVERASVFLANVGVNLGVATTTQETAIQAGGVIGVVTAIQVLSALVSHYYTPASVPRVSAPVVPSATAEAAAKAAGKAV